MRKIGIGLGSYGEGCSIEEQIRLMAENGFETTFSMSSNEKLGTYVAGCREVGIAYENCHAPFNGINGIWSSDIEVGEAMLGRLIDSVRACAKYEIPTLVVHLSSGEQPPRINDIGCARFDRLMDEARHLGVTIAYENQRKLANLAMAMEQYPDAGFCWDTGHEACFARGREFMPLFGSRLAALHLHDNHGEYDRDEHMLPYDGTIDLARAARYIAQSGYKGSIMLEVIRQNSHFYDDLSPEAYYRRAAEAARRFADAVEAASV